MVPANLGCTDAVWDPDQYLSYADHRRRPVLDLLSRVPTAGIERIIDLGCGPGQLSAVLRQRWPHAHITGVDHDPAMLERARAEHGGGDIDYQLADIATWEPDGLVDLVFSNAALHWIPHHLELLPRYLGWLTPTGTLAVQVPGNTAAPSHTELAALRQAARWRPLVGAGANDHVAVHPPGVYAGVVAAAGRTPDAWETTYTQVLTGTDPVVEWLKGSTLRPVLASLTPEDHEPFLTELAARLRVHYPPDEQGRTFFGFRRIFVVGRPGAQDEP